MYSTSNITEFINPNELGKKGWEQKPLPCFRNYCFFYVIMIFDLFIENALCFQLKYIFKTTRIPLATCQEFFCSYMNGCTFLESLDLMVPYILHCANTLLPVGNYETTCSCRKFLTALSDISTKS